MSEDTDPLANLDPAMLTTDQALAYAQVMATRRAADVQGLSITSMDNLAAANRAFAAAQDRAAAAQQAAAAAYAAQADALGCVYNSALEIIRSASPSAYDTAAERTKLVANAIALAQELRRQVQALPTGVTGVAGA